MVETLANVGCDRSKQLPAFGLFILATLAASTGACSKQADSSPIRELREPEHRGFVDVAQQVGITHQHHKPILDSKLDNIMSWMTSVGAAAAAGDYDKDGWIDLFVTDSRKGEPNRLYRNNADGSFTEVGVEAGLATANGDAGTSMDAVWGDYDNDGWVDLYLVRWGRDSLYRNNGVGADGSVTFTEVTQRVFREKDGKPGTDWANGNAAIFIDFDLDGRLDIYVGNYFREVDLWNLDDTRILHEDFETARNGGGNFLYHQEADGRFTEIATEMGLDDIGWTLAVGTGDLNGDGWPDIYGANDFGPDQLFLSNGDGTLRNATETILGFDTKKGMNVDFGDVDNDGWLDIYVTNITTDSYLQEGNMLWYNQGPIEGGEIALTDIAWETGTYNGGWGWGGKFFDHDNDGDLDIVAVNGFISAGEGNYWYDLASWTVLGEDSADARNWPTIGGRSFSGYEATRVWRNDGFYTFAEEAGELGLDSTRDGRGIVTFDYDNDGDLDLFIANQGQAPHLFRNDLSSPDHWLTVTIETDPSTGVNRDGIGTRVTLVTESGLLMRERDGGNGFSGQSDPRLHFGLGASRSVRLLEVRWPDGARQYLRDVEPDQILVVRQNPSRYSEALELDAEGSGWTPPEIPDEPTAIAFDPAEVQRELAEMESRLRAEPTWDRQQALAYRSRAVATDQHDRSIAFLEELANDRQDPALRLELSLAYVDSIPSCGGLAAIVCKGSRAKKSLDQLDSLLAEHPESWLTLYARGTNHLHWPRALRHSDDAAKDFERCIEIQSQAGITRPYHLRAWIGLGQAYAKAGRFDAAQDAWRRGLEVFPGAEELQEHLAVEGDEAVLAFVQQKRSLEQDIDTDLTFFEGRL